MLNLMSFEVFKTTTDKARENKKQKEIVVLDIEIQIPAKEKIHINKAMNEIKNMIVESIFI